MLPDAGGNGSGHRGDPRLGRGAGTVRRDTGGGAVGDREVQRAVVGSFDKAGERKVRADVVHLEPGSDGGVPGKGRSRLGGDCRGRVAGVHVERDRQRGAGHTRGGDRHGHRAAGGDCPDHRLRGDLLAAGGCVDRGGGEFENVPSVKVVLHVVDVALERGVGRRAGRDLRIQFVPQDLAAGSRRCVGHIADVELRSGTIEIVGLILERVGRAFLHAPARDEVDPDDGVLGEGVDVFREARVRHLIEEKPDLVTGRDLRASG